MKRRSAQTPLPQAQAVGAAVGLRAQATAVPQAPLLAHMCLTVPKGFKRLRRAPDEPEDQVTALVQAVPEKPSDFDDKGFPRDPDARRQVKLRRRALLQEAAAQRGRSAQDIIAEMAKRPGMLAADLPKDQQVWKARSEANSAEAERRNPPAEALAERCRARPRGPHRLLGDLFVLPMCSSAAPTKVTFGCECLVAHQQ